ncbi:MAG: hypothetical protein ACYTDY_05095 [Planctomycetota bacterium]
MKNARIVALVLCVLFAGCVSSVITSEVDREYKARYSFGERFGLWWLDRFQDTLFDGAVIPQTTFTFGFGNYAEVHNGLYAFGGGWVEGYSVGMKERALGVWHEKRKEYGFAMFYWRDLHRETAYGIPAAFEHDYDYTGWDLLEDKPVWKEDETHWSDFGFAVPVLPGLTLGANWSLIEFWDAALGWISTPVSLPLVLVGFDQPFWDLKGDDRWNLIRKELEAEGLGE